MKLIKEILVGAIILFFLILFNVFLFTNAFGNIFLEIILVFTIIVELFLFYRLIYKVFFNPNRNILFKKKYERKIRKIPINKEFKELYYSIEKNITKELEKIRKRVAIIYVVTMLLSILCCVLVLLISDGHNSSRRINLEEVIVFLPVIIGYYFYNKNNKKYVKMFKENIITNFVYSINHNLEYNPDGEGEMISLYSKAKFEDNHFNSYNVDDYIGGYYKNVYINLCDMSLEVVDEKDKVLRIVKQGIFTYTKISGDIQEEIRIKKNDIKLGNKNNIELDSEEFEKYFDVYCKSKIIAYQVLTTDVMEVLVEFYKKFYINFEIIIRNNNIYIMLNTGKMFEPKIFRKSTNIQTLWMYFNIIEFTINLTTEVNKVLKDTYSN